MCSQNAFANQAAGVLTTQQIRHPYGEKTELRSAQKRFGKR